MTELTLRQVIQNIEEISVLEDIVERENAFKILLEKHLLVLPLLTKRYDDGDEIQLPDKQQFNQKYKATGTVSDITVSDLLGHYSLEEPVFLSESLYKLLQNYWFGDRIFALSVAECVELACRVRPFRIDVYTKIARPKYAKDLDEPLTFPAALEKKYDGMRGQIHFTDHDLRIFSRSGTNMFKLFKGPDMTQIAHEYLKEAFPNVRGVFDAEIIKLDIENNTVDPHGLLNINKTTPEELGLIVFDVMGLYESGELLDLRGHSYSDRRQVLFEECVETPNVRLSEQVAIVDTIPEGELDLFAKDTKTQCPGIEGLIMKPLERNYHSPGWVKIKPVFDAEFGIRSFFSREKKWGTQNYAELYAYNSELQEVDVHFITVRKSLLEDIDTGSPELYHAKVEYQWVDCRDGMYWLRHPKCIEVNVLSSERPITTI